jgi:hypothetical protein
MGDARQDGQERVGFADGFSSRQSSSMVSSLRRNNARWSACRSSRMFPGQGRRESAAIASSAMDAWGVRSVRSADADDPAVEHLRER